MHEWQFNRLYSLFLPKIEHSMTVFGANSWKSKKITLSLPKFPLIPIIIYKYGNS